jgi:GNAT superfamily N-acetyltransferase
MFPPGLAVRAVRPTDNEAVRALFISVHSELLTPDADRKLRIALKDETDAGLNDDLARASVYYAGRNRRMWVLESQEREIVAFAGFDAHEAVRGVGSLRRLAVDSRFRRMSVGRLLVQRTEQWARQHGFWHIRLYVGELQPAARSLFLSLGYSEKEIAADGPIAVYEMMKSLSMQAAD